MSQMTRSAILRISDEKSSELVDLYKSEECLWNTTSPCYRDKAARARATDRIARKLAVKHFDAYHVTVKFKNLRNSYCQELKKVSKSIESGALGEDVYRPKVFWFEKMDSFLRPHLQQWRSSSSRSAFTVHDEVSKGSKESGDGDYTSGIVLKTEPADREDSGAEEPEEWLDREELIVPGSASDSFSDDDAQSVKIKRARSPGGASKRIKTEGQRLKTEGPCSDQNCSSQVLKTISSQLEALAGPRDDTFDTFGKYVASLLRGMPAPRALALQPRIVSLVTSAAIRGSDDRVSQSGQNT